VVSTTPQRLYPRERPGTHYTGGWVGSQGRYGRVRKISPPPEFFFSVYLFVSCIFVVPVLFWYWTKDGMPWIFPAGKIRRLRSGANPRSWVPEASMQTPRPPKPLGIRSPDRPARSQSLYLLSYLAHRTAQKCCIKPNQKAKVKYEIQHTNTMEKSRPYSPTELCLNSLAI
jgi:hypothetical protein